jgi:hypothetical protein
MKRIKIAFLTVCVLFIGLSVLAKNNFSENGFGWFEDTEKEIKFEVFQKFIQDDFVNGLAVCYQEAYPHLFMTKCYAEFYCELTNFERGKDHSERTIWIESTYSGNVYFDDCGNKSHICSLRANYKERKIEVRESFFGEWLSADDFMASFCEKTAAIKKERESSKTPKE